MQFKYKNVIITDIYINPERVTGTIDGKKFTVLVLEDTHGQYIIVNNCRYYINWFK